MSAYVTASSSRNNQSGTAGQLRGKKLEARLIELLNIWCKDEAERGEKWCYTQAAFAKYAGVSRETIRSKQRILDVILSELSHQRRFSTGAASLEVERKQNSNLKAEVDELKMKLEILRKHHLNIFSTLLRNSSALADLIVDEVGGSDIVVCQNCGCKVMFLHKNN
jgi:hypothetical protein